MLKNRLRGALVVLAASAGLGACTSFGPYGGVGVGVGSQYGYGSPYGYGYGDPYSYYNGYRGGYPYYGWYDGYYYPGAGYWVYDPDGNPRPISERQRNYFANLLKKYREEHGGQASAQVKENWTGFRTRNSASATGTAPATAVGSADQGSLRQIARARREAQAERQEQVRAERQQARSERQEAFRQQVIERREQRRGASKPTDE